MSKQFTPAEALERAMGCLLDIGEKAEEMLEDPACEDAGAWELVARLALFGLEPTWAPLRDPETESETVH